MTSVRPRHRVLFYESNFDGTIGGSHYCLLYLVEGLDKDRFEPLVMFPEDHALVPRFRDAAETIVRERPKPFVPAIMRSPLARRLPWLFFPVALLQRTVNAFGFVALVRRNISLIKSRKIEIVHLNNSIVRSHDWKLAALLTGTPCVTHERGINNHYPWVAKALGRRQKAVISMSKSIADYMAIGGVDMHNVLVLYDGVDPKALRVTRTPEAVRQELNIPADAPVVGIVGNVRHWKGQEVVIRALPLLVKTYPSLVCLIVGKAGVSDREYEEKLHGLVREFGIERNVRFMGYQKHPADAVNIMNVVIHASIQPEPFGMVVLEAMALGKPVVGSRAGGVPEMVVEGVTGFTFPPGDSETLAARVGELLADPQRARAMGEAGHARVVSDFNVATYVRDVETLYDHVMAGRPLPPLGPAAAQSPSRAHVQ